MVETKDDSRATNESVFRFTKTRTRGSNAGKWWRDRSEFERDYYERRLFIYTANYRSFLRRWNSTAISIDG